MRPKPGCILFSSLFENLERGRSLERVADGISCCVDNAGRLLSDVHVLLAQGRFSSAHFLLTTAKEELGKAFILIDMCRLDFHEHQSVLRRLARAFYVHEAKQAYFSTLQFNGFLSMDDVRRFWEKETVRWWPNEDPESGEPDMPHQSYFDRELPLYVDFIDYDGDWWVPSNRHDRLHFRDFLDPDVSPESSTSVTRVRSVLDELQQARADGLLSEVTLTELNDGFAGFYFKETSSKEELDTAYARLARRVSDRLRIDTDRFMKSILVSWPLYHFASQRL